MMLQDRGGNSPAYLAEQVQAFVEAASERPEIGSPAGGGTFTWTAAVWLAWASPSQGEN